MRRTRLIVRVLPVVATIAITLGGAPSDVRGQDVPRVAILDFNSFMMGSGGATIELGKAVAAMLVTEFSGFEGIQVLERQALHALLDEQDLQLSGRTLSEDRAVEIGRILGVQYVLAGQVMSISDNLRMDIRAIDVETSEVVTTLKRTDKTEELFGVVVGLADDFSDKLDLVPPSERPEVEIIPVAATIAFSRALDYEDEGDIDQAIAQYELTLEHYPNHREARRALDRLRGS